jgi:PhnB protein
MANYKPDGWPTIVPRLFAGDVPGLVAFLKLVFGAEGELEIDRPSELRIGDSIILVSDGGGVRALQPAFLYVYVPDVDDAFERALGAGAKAVERPAEMPWGHRRATFEDPWGNTWQAATAHE